MLLGTGRATALEVASGRAKEGSVPGVDNIELRRGWHLGGEIFLSRLLDRLEGKVTENHRARERAETNEVKAEKISQAGLQELGWTEKDLRERKKCVPEKVRLAQQARAETTLSLKRVAERLHMGTWTNTSNLLHKARRLRS